MRPHMPLYHSILPTLSRTLSGHQEAGKSQKGPGLLLAIHVTLGKSIIIGHLSFITKNGHKNTCYLRMGPQWANVESYCRETYQPMQDRPSSPHPPACVPATPQPQPQPQMISWKSTKTPGPTELQHHSVHLI